LSNVRVTYSGLIAFVVGIIGVITGIIFTIIVTRKLSPDELGLWTLVGSLVSYVVVIEPIISFWTERQIARGEEVGATALATSGLFSVGAIIAYLIIVMFVSFSSLEVDLNVLLLASVLVPLTFLNNTLRKIAISYKPQAISYSTVVFEASKLPFGFLLVYLLPFGLVGAIIATIIASIARIIILIIAIRERLYYKIKREIIKFWLRLSWIPLYSSGSGFVLTLDVLVYSLLTNSLVGLAFWAVGSAVANIISHSGQISQALYPKLLATGKKEFAEENLKKLMYFAIPFLGAAIVFAKPALHVLNPLYIEGIYIVYFLSFRSLAYILMNIFFNVISAYEKVDLDKQASFKQYAKSKLFFLPTLNYILTGTYIATLVLFLIISESLNLDEVQLVTTWSLILLIVTIPFMLYGLISVHRHHQISLPYKSMLKYAFVTLVSSIIVYFISDNFLEYSESIFDFLPQLIPIILLGGIIYFGLTYIIDKSTRKLFKSIINELRKKR